jgi:hypothetical protein
MSWNEIDAKPSSSTGSDDLLTIGAQTKIRLLLTGGKTPGEPDSYRSYGIDTPTDGYATFIAPEGEDFFGQNRQAFRLRYIHVGLVYDYSTSSIKILEAGNQIWKEIKKFRDMGIDVLASDLMLSKSGSGLGTKYGVIYLPPAPLPFNPESLPAPDLATRYRPSTYEGTLAALKRLGFVHPEQLFTPRPLAYDQATQIKVPFGKFRDQTIADVLAADSSYLDFLAGVDNPTVQQAARVVSNQIMGTSYDVTGICPAVTEVDFVDPKAGQAQTAPQNAQTQGTPQGVAPGYTPVQPQYQTPAAPVQPQYQQAPPVANQYQAPVAPVQPQAPAQPQAPVQPQYQQAPAAPVSPAQPAWLDNGAPAPAPQAPVQPAPAPQVAPAAPVQPAPAGGQQAIMAEISNIFENDPKYKDFTKIIAVMQQASGGQKTNLAEFTNEELTNLLAAIKQ